MHAAPARPITPAGSHHSFGYYDRCPFSPDGRHHLALRLPQHDRLPAPEERAALCRIDLASGAIAELTTTAAWNHQQGSMQHWLPGEAGCVVLNDRDGERVFSRVIDAAGRTLRELPRPVYCLSRDGRQAASLDFGRIPRRGYSYAVRDPSVCGGPRRPPEEGLWLMDTSSGAARRLASYAEMLAIHPDPDDLRLDPYVWLNHAIFNADDSRLMVLLRYRLHEQGWKTYIYTVGLDGSGLRCALPHAYWQAGRVTHQMWGRRPGEILLDADFRSRGDGELTVFEEGDGKPVFRVLAAGFRGHGHQRFAPDGRWLVSDTYPRGAGEQQLSLVEVATGQVIDLGRYAHPLPGPSSPLLQDCRCDLHPRWSPDGRRISIDSIADGWRRVYLIDLVE